MKEQFERWGYVRIRDFYTRDAVQEVQEGIHRLVGLTGGRQEPFSPTTFDSGLNESNRGVIYDAVKKLPAYIALATCSQHEAVARELLDSDIVGFANRGYGIRMDHPNDDSYLTQIHQDYTHQLCSPSGVVFWSPLRTVTFKDGPPVIYPGSHKKGIQPIRLTGDGSYGLQLMDEAAAVADCLPLQIEMEPTDVLILHALTLHRSAPNRGEYTRWAMISRYFDFNEEIGRANGWKGGLQEGNSFAAIHPELSEVSFDVTRTN